MEQYDEQKSWELYCALNANPFSEIQSVSFAEFLQKLKPEPEAPEPVMNQAWVQLQVKQAETLLQGFTPPGKEG